MQCCLYQLLIILTMSLLSSKQDCTLLQLLFYFSFTCLWCLPQCLAHRKHSGKLCSIVFIFFSQCSLPLSTYFLLLRRGLSSTKHSCKEKQKCNRRDAGSYTKRNYREETWPLQSHACWIHSWIHISSRDTKSLNLLFFFPFDYYIDRVEIYRQYHCPLSVKLALKVCSYPPSQLSSSLSYTWLYIYASFRISMFLECPLQYIFSDIFYCL